MGLRSYPTRKLRVMVDPIAERFWLHVNKFGPLPDGRPDLGPCWLRTAGRMSSNGYSNFVAAGKQHVAHRIAYEWLVGAIPDDHDLDHLCHNFDLTCPGGVECWHRMCVNPDHLEPVPHRTNILRGKHPNVINARSGACMAGHERIPENVIYERGGKRRCRPCDNARARARHHRKKV
jgi:hypothetical protein